MEAFQLPSPVENLPSTGWLPANKLPTISVQHDKLHPLANGIKRLPLESVTDPQAVEKSSQTPVKPMLKPKIPRAAVGTALQSMLAQQAALQAPASACKEQRVSIVNSSPAKGPAAPLFAKRNNCLPGASKPAAQSQALAPKHAARKPPLAAKRPLPASGQQAKAAAVKRPKVTKQKSVSAPARPALAIPGASANPGQSPVQDTSAGMLLPSKSQQSSAHLHESLPTSHNHAGNKQSEGLPSDAANAAQAPDGQTTSTAAAPRKRTQLADVDAAAVELKVASLRAEGKSSSLTVPELKTWLKARKLPVSGKKADLVARLEIAAPFPT